MTEAAEVIRGLLVAFGHACELCNTTYATKLSVLRGGCGERDKACDQCADDGRAFDDVASAPVVRRAIAYLARPSGAWVVRSGSGYVGDVGHFVYWVTHQRRALRFASNAKASAIAKRARQSGRGAKVVRLTRKGGGGG